jgi:hypothetical protein
MKVSISAIGSLRKYIPEPKDIELDLPVSLLELREIAGIPEKVTASYTVNGKVQRGDYAVQDNDSVRFIMIVGAG